MPVSSILSGHPVQTDKLVFRKQGDRVLVYNAITDQMYLLWPRAAEILKRCDGTRTTAQLTAESLADEPRLAAHGEVLVTRLLGQFEKRRLISWRIGED
jgi:hypothetical protein